MNRHVRTILITGANGLLGMKLVDKLRERGAIILVATARGGNRNPVRDGYQYAEMDILSPAQIDEIMALHKPDVVIHGAAMTNVDECEREPAMCRALNVDGTRNMVRACEKWDARIIHVSTDFIFDGESGPYDEKATPNPISEYGRSKWEAEQIVMEGKAPWAIARTMLVYGVIPDHSRSNIVLWAIKALREGKAINVVDDQFRSPTLAEDLADGIIQIAMRNKTGIYNLSGPETLSILEIVKKVAEHFQLDEALIKPTDSASLNQPAKRPPRTGFIILKAQSELGYRPRTVREGIMAVHKQLSMNGML